MGSHAFDTLKAAKRLGAAGFDLDQSESLAGIIGESFTDKLATKDDLRNLEMRLTGKIEVLDTKIESVEERLTGKIEVLDIKIDSVEEHLTGKIEKQGIDVGMQIATIKAEIAEAQVSLHRWMIGLVVTLVLGFTGIIVVG